MFLCMRTTVDISDDLLIELKRVAAETRRSLKDLIEDAIRTALARRHSSGEYGTAEKVITYRGRGVKHGVNLDSMQELLDIMDNAP